MNSFKFSLTTKGLRLPLGLLPIHWPAAPQFFWRSNAFAYDANAERTISGRPLNHGGETIAQPRTQMANCRMQPQRFALAQIGVCIQAFSPRGLKTQTLIKVSELFEIADATTSIRTQKLYTPKSLMAPRRAPPKLRTI